MLYLSTPFSHRDPVVMQQRYQKSCRAQAKLIAAGIVVLNPLANSVPAVELGGLNATHEQFMALDIPLLQRSDELLILGLEGWEQSLGVRKEMFEALSLRKPITVIEEADIENLPKIPKSARRFLKSTILPDSPYSSSQTMPMIRMASSPTSMPCGTRSSRTSAAPVFRRRRPKRSPGTRTSR